MERKKKSATREKWYPRVDANGHDYRPSLSEIILDLVRWRTKGKKGGEHYGNAGVRIARDKSAWQDNARKWNVKETNPTEARDSNETAPEILKLEYSKLQDPRMTAGIREKVMDEDVEVWDDARK